ncbi:MAG: hypothetical protein LBE20_00435 [Deltaproteobacteria bacterium]|nr:hypothetical protein [Deltaproteobacteria bacterium]
MTQLIAIALILDQENKIKDNYVLDDPCAWGFVEDGRKVFLPPQDSVPLKERAKGNNVFVSLSDERFFQLSKDDTWIEFDEKYNIELRGYMSASRTKVLSLVD